MPDLATRADHEEEVALLILLYLQDIEFDLRNGGAVDWLGWTANLSRELTTLLAATFAEAAEQLVGEHDGWTNDADDRARQWASQRANWIAGNMATTTRDAAYEGMPEDWHFSGTRAESVAITETTAAISEGEHYGAAELAALAIMLIPVWVTEEDDRVCPICDPLNRQRQNVWQGLFPTGPPGHPNCLLPWNKIVAPGRIVAATKAFYVGRCVEATFANGSVISVTENHPVLTTTGWIPAKFLAEAGNAICAADSQRMALSINPYDDHRPSAIEQVFRSIKEAAGVISTSVPSSAKQFHGDGVSVDGQVEIVYADSFLRSAMHSSFVKPSMKDSFRLALPFKSSLNGRRPRQLFRNSVGSSASGSVCLAKHGVPVCSGCGRPSHVHRVGNGSWRDSSIQDSSSEGWPGDANLASEFLFRFSEDVTIQDVVKVRNFDWRGHVYDLQVEPYALYTCNGILVHNCRCRMEWVRV